MRRKARRVKFIEGNVKSNSHILSIPLTGLLLGQSQGLIVSDSRFVAYITDVIILPFKKFIPT